MENMDATVIATALPVIAADIGASPITLKLALTSYYVALGVFIPVSGRIADRCGPRKVFQLAILVFMLGSLACALAQSLEGFVAARFLQGAGGAMMTPVGRLLLVRGTPKEELVSAMAWFSLPALVAPLVGPPLGGAFATYADWRWIFLINLPIGAVGVWLAGRHVPLIAPMPETRLDMRGFLLSGLGCAGVVFGCSIVTLPGVHWAWGAGLTAFGALSGWAYLRHARSRPDPLLRLDLLAIPAFRAAMTGGTLFRVGIGAVPFLTPLMLQLGFGYSAFESGLITCVSIGGAMAMKLLARPILNALGFKAALVITALAGGLLIAPIGFWRPETPLVALLALLLVGGFFRSLFFTAVNALAYAEVPAARTGDATALMGAAQQMSLAAGVAGAALILEFSHGAGDALAPADFGLAFAVVGVVAAASALAFLTAPDDAGAGVLDRRRGRKGAEPAE